MTRRDGYTTPHGTLASGPTRLIVTCLHCGCLIDTAFTEEHRATCPPTTTTPRA